MGGLSAERDMYTGLKKIISNRKNLIKKPTDLDFSCVVNGSGRAGTLPAQIHQHHPCSVNSMSQGGGKNYIPAPTQLIQGWIFPSPYPLE